MFEGISSLTCNKITLTLELRSSLYGLQNPSIKNRATAKLSSIFAPQIINISTLPLICFESNSNLFRIFLHKDFKVCYNHPLC